MIKKIIRMWLGIDDDYNATLMAIEQTMSEKTLNKVVEETVICFLSGDLVEKKNFSCGYPMTTYQDNNVTKYVGRKIKEATEKGIADGISNLNLSEEFLDSVVDRIKRKQL